ncbi:S-adenosyl-L-methionine-dependent methyltransferase [Clohesyomyces aquaticus]|uniref:S-adenosyl-L-methionine-dependent methyltransferase n=1 Tax=Clohesyomyces aquaticus TaxID=1231657 RepID=A0A1Y1ZNM7_9PLEO|nr:S-adenosyl-L-methionine-dependent methyltransferase [Clohesyomyces aquaticus]
MADISELTKQLAALASAPPTDLSEEERFGLFNAINQARDAFMSPRDALLRFSFSIYESAAVRLAIDLKLLDIAVPAGRSLTSPEIAEKAGADVQLVGRILRMLAAVSLLTETAPDTFAAKPLAGAFCTGSPLREGIIHLSSHASAAGQLPDYFAKNGYKNPGDAFNGPWQYAQKTNKHYFDWLSGHPDLQHAFNVVMGISRIGQVDWFEYYPVEEKLKVSSPEQILLVDVGGGVGHDVAAFQKKFPNLPGKLVFEDLSIVVDSAKDTPAGVTGVGHDFFKPQPETVKGAKAYYLRTVLHDWPDKEAATIVRNLKDVMAEDSVLLINENVLPDQGVSLFQAELDMSMMVCFSSLDRTEKQFKTLLESEGFEWKQTYKPEVQIPGSGTLMEFHLKK